MRKARSGDLSAIADLLVIDKTIIFEPKIQKTVFYLAHKEPRRYQAVIVKALQKKIPKISKKKLKATVSGILSAISAVAGGLTAAEIKDLFDRVHYAKTGNPADPDIPEKVWAFPKAIQRERSEWINTLNLNDPGQK
jgi:glutamyl/glutaminyl-tRNA synthetase